MYEAPVVPIPHRRRRFVAILRLLALFALMAATAACGDNLDDDYLFPYPEPAGSFTLQLLHAADMESGGEAVDDAPRFSAILSSLRGEMPMSTVVLCSGDNYIGCPFFSASVYDSLKALVGDTGTGLADILILNAMGFQASALGNHEFDFGADVVAELISDRSIDDDEDGTIDSTYQGAAFPYLSANMDFFADADLGPLAIGEARPVELMSGLIGPSTVIAVGADDAGEKHNIGVVGATTPNLAALSNPGGDIIISPPNPNDTAALAAVIQEEVDKLVALGINKIILVAHMQQLSIEQALAPLLSDVDIIIAGGSNSILVDETDRLRAGDEDRVRGEYPIELESATGEPLLVVNTDGNYRYVGRLVVEFSERGVLNLGSIDPEVSGAYATDEEGMVELGMPPVDETVAELAAAVGDVIKAQDGNLFGASTVYLNGERSFVRTEETNLGNLTADANLAIAREVDTDVRISLKNGGGIRAPIGLLTYPPNATSPEDLLRLPTAANPTADKEEGDVSQLDITNALRFNNELTLVTVTAEKLVELIEHGVSATEPGATPGRFPHVAGMRFSFDPALEPGARVRSLIVFDPDGGAPDIVVEGGALQGDATRTFRIVSLNFLVGGGDGYPFPAEGDADFAMTDIVSLEESGMVAEADIEFAPAGSEQHALAKYLRDNYPRDAQYDVEDVGPEFDERIQNLSARDDTVIPVP